MDEPHLTLAQGRLRCLVALRGAELRSLSDGAEQFIWQRDPAIWADSAPLLFPVVGRLKDGSYLHQGQRYRLPIHGFARVCPFELLEQSAASATLVLRDSAATLATYPFRFVLKVMFTLEEHCLHVRYRVHNPAAGTLLFSLGSHPGLRIPPTARGLADWSLLFDAEEAPECYRLDGDLLAAAPTPLAFAGPRRIALSDRLFDADALIFKKLRSRHVRLVHRSGRVRASVATGGAPMLGLWSRPGAPYVCIEPWHGVDDDAGGGGELAAKPGIVSLSAGATFSTGYSICMPPY